MAQPFALRYPLVHGEGNFGSLDGDGAAAMRYTEARLTALAEEMLDDLGADTVPFRANYDATLDEPIVLPSAHPAAPDERLDRASPSAWRPTSRRTTCARSSPRWWRMIDEPELDVKGLMKHMKGPDFPTGGEILNAQEGAARDLRDRAGRRSGCAASTRSRRCRAASSRSSSRRSRTPSTSRSWCEQIASEIIARKLPLVVDVRDESTTDVRVVLELKPDASPEAAMAYLYKHTGLQTNFNVNLTCLAADRESRRRPAGARHAARPLPALPRLPHDRGDAPARAREAQAPGAPAHPRGARQDLRRPRPRDPHHPQGRVARRRRRRS